MGIDTIISLFSLIKSFFPLAKDPIDDEVQAYVLKFKLLQSIHLETQQMLKDFIVKHECGDSPLVTGYTYSQYLKYLEDSYSNSNTDQIMEDSLSVIKTKPELDIFRQEIDDQYQKVNYIYQNLKQFKDR